MSASEENLNEQTEEEFYTGFMDSLDSDGIYLSGPIRCVDDNGHGWRETVKEQYSEFNYNSPLDAFDPEEVEVLNDPVDFDPEEEKEQVYPSEYVFSDKKMINESEVILIGIPDVKARGTMMEAMYGYMRGTPFFVWVIDGQEESGWIFDHCEFMSDNLDEVMREIREWQQ